MSENPYSILFEPVQIGPVTAPNRFYQVPHCNGLGHRMPQSLATMRGVKAEGGWGVVCTEEVEIHHSSDLSPNVEGRLWDDADIPALQLMTEAVHQHGALAGIELTYSGMHAGNLTSRVPALAPRSMGFGILPGQARAADKTDIKNIRSWHRQAALRARKAGFDIISVYAGHNLSLAMHFLLKRYNDRTDEYGGSLKNRTRFLRELIEDTREAVGDACGVAVRLAVDELMGAEGLQSSEARDIVSMLADLPDLWDVNLSDWNNDSAPSRFEKEGWQERYTSFVKEVTNKPVVGVGRYTSPESMVSAIQRGVMDLLGAARPSIADPFLPEKIRTGRVEDIRECIGCNICASGDMQYVPIRCTQNPTMGEEWRRGWHPEIIPPVKTNQGGVVVIGAGPAGLECARALGQRGVEVSLLDASRQAGGRVLLEAELPGLSEWRRVIDWRLTQIEKMTNVKFFPSSPMRAEEILESGFKNIFVATGAQWRRDGIGRNGWKAIPGHNLPYVFTPDDLLDGKNPNGQVLVYDDDHYTMGGLLAELLAEQGCKVTLVTPQRMPSAWTVNTLEQEHIEKRLLEMGVEIVTTHKLASIQKDACLLEHTLTGAKRQVACQAVVLVTDRIPQDGLYYELLPHLESGQLESLKRIGDADTPHTIAQAIYSGHLAAREFGEFVTQWTPFKVERPSLEA